MAEVIRFVNHELKYSWNQTLLHTKEAAGSQTLNYDILKVVDETQTVNHDNFKEADGT